MAPKGDMPEAGSFVRRILFCQLKPRLVRREIKDEIIGKPKESMLLLLPSFLYGGTSLIRNRRPLGPYSRTMPRALWWPYGGGCFL